MELYGLGERTGKLGFGLMRLPRKGVRIDIAQTKQMVDLFLEAGFTYFDTAYVYPGSEKAAQKALVERHPRASYTLATKLNAAIPGIGEKMAKKQFQTSLERTGAEYFDFVQGVPSGHVLRILGHPLCGLASGNSDGSVRHVQRGADGGQSVLHA